MTDLGVVCACRWRLRLVWLRAAGHRSPSLRPNPFQDALTSSSISSPDSMGSYQASILNIGDIVI